MSDTAKQTHITHGPFTWKREDQRGDEAWRVQLPNIPGLTSFCIKNYGGEPGPGFSGWKLVSGGPINAAGAYASREQALEGITPWLVRHYAQKAQELREDAERIAALIEGFVSEITAKH